MNILIAADLRGRTAALLTSASLCQSAAPPYHFPGTDFSIRNSGPRRLSGSACHHRLYVKTAKLHVKLHAQVLEKSALIGFFEKHFYFRAKASCWPAGIFKTPPVIRLSDNYQIPMGRGI